MYRLIAYALFAILASADLPAIASDGPGRTLHLVGNVASPVEYLPHADARKLFMGVPLIRNEQRLMPLLNNSSTTITEIFLQKIIFMSRRDYERQLVSRIYRFGGSRPAEYATIDELLQALQANKNAISYMWSDQFDQVPDIKSLGVIWSGSID